MGIRRGDFFFFFALKRVRGWGVGFFWSLDFGFESEEGGGV